MSYFINVSYPELTTSKPSKLFHSWLGDYRIIDDNGNWNFIADIYIFGNFYLPPNSFYAEFRTFFTTINKINLIWKQNITREYINNNQAYSIEKYSINFNIPTNSSSFFKDYISYKKINFQIDLSFNLNNLSDFTINVNQKNLNNFLENIQESTCQSEFIYRNFYNLDESLNSINFSLIGDIERKIDFYAYNLFASKTIKKILRINKYDDEPIVIKNQKLKINYKFISDNEIKTLSINLDERVINDKESYIDLSNYIMFDVDTKELLVNNISNDNNTGIFIPYESHGIIEFEFDISYHNKIRHFKLERQFIFDENLNEFSNTKFTTKNIVLNEKLIFGVQNENIF